MSVTIKMTADELCWKSEHSFVYRMGQSRRTCPDLSLLNPQRPLHHLDTILDPSLLLLLLPATCSPPPSTVDANALAGFTYVYLPSSLWLLLHVQAIEILCKVPSGLPISRVVFFFFPIQQTPTAWAIFLHHTLFRDCALLLKFKLGELYKAHMIRFLPPFYSHLQQCSSPQLF